MRNPFNRNEVTVQKPILYLINFEQLTVCRENGKTRDKQKYVVKHKSAKLFMTYAVGKLEAALNISHLILSTSSQRVRVS